MPGSLPGVRSRTSVWSWRSLPYNLRSRQQSSSIANANPPAQEDNESEDSSIIFDESTYLDDQSEHSSHNTLPPPYFSVVSGTPDQNSNCFGQNSNRNNPLSDGIPHRSGDPIPQGYS